LDSILRGAPQCSTDLTDKTLQQEHSTARSALAPGTLKR
jgi:hypothetical protein